MCEEGLSCDHWFALKVYDAYILAKEKVKENNAITIPVLTERPTIHHSSLCAAVDAIQCAAKLSTIIQDRQGRGIMASLSVRSQEVTFSCLYARALDHFLFEDKDLGAVLHQGPSRKREHTHGTAEIADIYIVPMQSYTPGDPIVQSDVKLTDFIIADQESTLYSINSVCIRHQVASTAGGACDKTLHPTPDSSAKGRSDAKNHYL